MRIRLAAAFVSVLLSCVAVGQSPPSTTSETVVVPSGNLRLKGHLWSPAGSAPSLPPSCSFMALAAAMPRILAIEITEAAEKLAPTFIKHGYAFLYLFLRGQGIFAGQGLFMRDVLQREKATKGGGSSQAFAVRSNDDGSSRRCHRRFVVLEKPTRSRLFCGKSFWWKVELAYYPRTYSKLQRLPQ